MFTIYSFALILYVFTVFGNLNFHDHTIYQFHCHSLSGMFTGRLSRFILYLVQIEVSVFNIKYINGSII